MMRAAVALLLLAGCKEAPPRRAVPPARLLVTHAEPQADDAGCSAGMPDAPGIDGCDAARYACARTCVDVCFDCKDDTATCMAAKDACMTGACKKSYVACNRNATAERKKNYGCKKKNLLAACADANACMHSDGCNGTDCIAKCEKQTGCDAFFQDMIDKWGCNQFVSPENTADWEP